MSFPLADSAADCAAARLLTYQVAQLADDGADPKLVHGRASMAKLFASEAAYRCADRCVQVFGGRGYMRTQRRRALPARAARRPHLGGHERDPAGDRRPRPREARRRDDARGGQARQPVPRVTAARDLQPLFAPRAVALVGASADPMAWGGWLARHPRRAGRPAAAPGQPARRRARRPPLPTRACRPCRSRPTWPCWPSRRTRWRRWSTRGSRRAPGRSWSSRRASPRTAADGRAAERALVERVRAAGGALVGPNCLGRLRGRATAQRHRLRRQARPGGLRRARAATWRSSSASAARRRTASATAASWPSATQPTCRWPTCSGRPPTTTRPGSPPATSRTPATAGPCRRGARVAERKPVLVLAAGRSAAGAAAAASHTGALAAPLAVLQAALEEAGARPVHSLGELADAAAALLAGARPARAAHGDHVRRRRERGDRRRPARRRRARGAGAGCGDRRRAAARDPVRPGREPGRPGRRRRADVLSFARIGETPARRARRRRAPVDRLLRRLRRPTTRRPA